MNTIRGHVGVGFTLIEALIATVILAMTVSVVAVSFSSGAKSELDDARRTLAANLAQEMMEEILSKPFNDPDGPSNVGPEPGETGRQDFDNIDDYDGYSENVTAPGASSNASLTAQAATGLSRNVSARYVYVQGQDTKQPATFMRLTVEVKYRDQPLAAFFRLAYAH